MELQKIAVDTKTAATAIGISQSKMYQLIAAGKIATFKIGRSTRIRIAELERFVKSLEEEGRR